MNKKVAIVDYGLGNILSAYQSFLKVINDYNVDELVYIDITRNNKGATYPAILAFLSVFSILFLLNLFDIFVLAVNT